MRLQAGFSVFIFVLLSSQDGFSTKWHADSEGISHAPALYNGAFSTIAFLIGAVTSIVSGWLGMKIATYANARTALEARKGIAPAFMAGVLCCASSCHRLPEYCIKTQESDSNKYLQISEERQGAMGAPTLHLKVLSR